VDDVGVGLENIDLGFGPIPNVDGQGLNLVGGVGIDERLRTGGVFDAGTSAITNDKQHHDFARMLA